jgi:hypothetical protein
LKTLKTAVRIFVFTFVFVAGHLTFAGLDPKAKAEAESVFNETEQNTQEKNLSTTKKKVLSVDTGTTG